MKRKSGGSSIASRQSQGIEMQSNHSRRQTVLNPKPKPDSFNQALKINIPNAGQRSPPLENKHLQNMPIPRPIPIQQEVSNT